MVAILALTYCLVSLRKLFSLFNEIRTNSKSKRIVLFLGWSDVQVTLSHQLLLTLRVLETGRRSEEPR